MKPMLCRLGSEEDLKKKGFYFEPKLDGTRAVCVFKKGKGQLINRRDRDITFRYPEFDFSGINADSCILDGEIVVYDEEGNPSFNLLQKRDQLQNRSQVEIRSELYPANYVVFDILKWNGKSLIGKGLKERKKILEEVVSDNGRVQKMFFTEDGKKLWRVVVKRKLEGVIAKKINSRYYPGKRVPVWFKIKYLKILDAVIVGYTQKQRVISALAVAVYDKGKLRYIGRVGTGFTEKFLGELHKKLKRIERKRASVDYRGKENVHWVKPEIVCEVRFLELSKDGIMRAPAFLRLREDKSSRECVIG